MGITEARKHAAALSASGATRYVIFAGIVPGFSSENPGSARNEYMVVDEESMNAPSFRSQIEDEDIFAVYRNGREY